MYGLNKVAAVYLPDQATGEYTVIARAGLACRLAVVQRGAVSVGDERESVGSDRRLLWSDPYAMPDDAQVAIDGDRWNVERGTQAEITGVDGLSIVYRRCEVTKVL